MAPAIRGTTTKTTVSTLRESNVISNVITKLPKIIHTQSMTFGSRSFNGTPDRYFDGPARDLWAEFKYVDAIPRDRLVGGVDTKKRGCYSPLQFDWMVRRLRNGGNVIGIIGLPNRTAVIQQTPEEWQNKSSIDGAVPFAAVAEWIRKYCMGEQA